MATTEHRSVSTWEDLQRLFREPINFLITGECVPFAFAFPPVEEGPLTLAALQPKEAVNRKGS